MTWYINGYAHGQAHLEPVKPDSMLTFTVHRIIWGVVRGPRSESQGAEKAPRRFAGMSWSGPASGIRAGKGATIPINGTQR